MSKQSSASCVPLRGRGRVSLFEAKRFDRIERCRAIRGIKSEADADGRTDHQAGDRPAVRKNEIRLKPGREQIAAYHSKQNPDNPACFRNENCFGEKLPENIAAPRANRFPDPDLLGAFRYA